MSSFGELEVLTAEVLAGEGLELLKRLSPKEKETAWGILKELREKGESKTLEAIWQLDYDIEPPTIREFLDSKEYLGHVGKDVFPLWQRELEIALDPINDIHEIVLRGCIGAGKSWVGAIITAYDLCLLLHLKNPQKFLTCAESSEISLGLVSTDLKQLQRNLWGYTVNFMKGSPFFRSHSSLREEMEYNSLFIKFPKKLVLVGGSIPNHILGLNLYSGCMDEANTRRAADAQEDALDFYLKIRGRVENRFLRRTGRGRITLLASEGDDKSFLNKHCNSIRAQPQPDHHICQFSEWEIRGHTLPLDGKFFKVDVGDQLRPPSIVEENTITRPGAQVIDVPEYYRKAASRGLIEFLKDIAGVVPGRANRFFYNVNALLECFTLVNPIPQEIAEMALDTTFEASDYIDEKKMLRKVLGKFQPLINPNASRFIHVDLAKNADRAGVAMVHVGDMAPGGSPIVREDFVVAFCASEKKPIDFDKIISFICWLRDNAGFAIHTVSYDTWQSLHSFNILDKKGFNVKFRSVDRLANDPRKGKLQPEYEQFRTMTAEGRVQLINSPLLKNEGVEMVVHDGKPDHPDGGSKDMMDATVGAVANLVDALGDSIAGTGDAFNLPGLLPVKLPDPKKLLQDRQLWGDRTAEIQREETFRDP